MRIQEDFNALLASFNAHDVEYLVVGGYALAFHGVPRFTGDLDLFVNPKHENAQHLLDALNDFGFDSLGLKVQDFVTPDHVVQLGVPPVRVDILTTIDGVSWEEAWAGHVEGLYGNTPVPFIGQKEFLANKKASGRARDLADIEALGEES